MRPVAVVLAAVMVAFLVLVPPVLAQEAGARALPGSALPVSAAASGWDGVETARARLVSATTGTDVGDTLRLGLEIALAEDWKAYWRSPGDAGYPPSIDWSDSVNVASSRFLWPAPERFEVLGLQTLGYHDHVILPLRVTPERPGEAVSLRAAVDFLACSDICIPVLATLSLDLPGGIGGATLHTFDIGRFEARVPLSGSAAPLSVEEAAATTLDGAPALRLVIAGDVALNDPDAFVETGAGLAFGAPRVERLPDRRAVLTLPARESATGSAAVPVGETVTITLTDGQRAAETRAVVAATPTVAVTDRLAVLLAMIPLALLGGVILNLMPCVLPVLSLKVMGAITLAGQTRGRVRLGFLASAAGIVCTFLAIGGALAAVKLAGGAIGWGIQFQQPLFLVTMVVVLTLFTANLWNLFQVPLPGWLSRGGTEGGAGNQGLAGHFATGVFATLLATPCSAPFLGTAVGFALSQDTATILAIFAALGVGMAGPYLLVALLPRLAMAIRPRPGAWMAWVKRVMGVALLGTAIWLITVLAAQTGQAAAGLVGLLMLLVLAGLTLRARAGGRLKPAALGLAVVAALGAYAPPVLSTPETGPQAGAPSLSDGPWTAWSRDGVAGAVAGGAVVLVDVTADWCVTCQVNKAAVLDRGAVARALADGAVQGRRADWTRPDPAIADYLADHGRYGIPFNAVYGPGAPDGIVLPELLTEAAVMAAVERAKGD